MIRLSLNVRVKQKIVEHLKEQHLIAANARPGNALPFLKAHGFTHTSSIFVRWLNSREEKMGIRVPASPEIARFLFHARNNEDRQSIFFFDVETLPAAQATLWRQEQGEEIEIACELDLEREGAFSRQEMNIIHDRLLPEALQRLSQIEKRITLGETYLKHAIKEAEAQNFSFPILKSTPAKENQLTITLDALALDEQKQENRDKTKTCKQERGTVTIIVEGASVEKRGQRRKERKTICKGTIRDFDEANWTLTLDIEKYSATIEPDRPEIPSHATVEYSALGDLTTQEKAIYRLKSGEGRLTVLPLDLLLYDANDALLASMAPLPETNIRPVYNFLQNHMNEEQKRAVELALATSDFFLLQGPPGTGKTTFISELCYQLVLQDKKVLVSSQSNLAVDNALSRLAEHPKILAIRLGAEDKVQEIGADFVGDRAVLRWIRSLSRESRQQLDELTNAKHLQSLLYSEEWNTITRVFIQINTWNLQRDKITQLQKEVLHHHQDREKIAEFLPELDELDQALEHLQQQIAHNISGTDIPAAWYTIKSSAVWSTSLPYPAMLSDPWNEHITVQREVRRLEDHQKLCAVEVENGREVYQRILQSRQQFTQLRDEQRTFSKSLQETRRQVTLLQQLLQDGSLETSTQEVHNVSQTYRDISPRIAQAKALLKGELPFSDLPYESRYPTTSLESKVSIWQTMELTLQADEATMWLQEIAIDLTNLCQQRSPGASPFSRQYNVLNTVIQQLKACIWVVECNISSFTTYNSALSKQLLLEYQHALDEARQCYQEHQHYEQEQVREQSALRHHLEEAEQVAKRLRLWLTRLYGSLTIEPPYNGAGEHFESLYSKRLPAVQAQLQQALEETVQKTSSIQERIEGIREWIVQQRGYLAQQQWQKDEHIQQLQQEMSRKQVELDKQAEQRLQVQSYLQQTWHEICKVDSSYLALYRYGSFPPLETFQSARRKWLESVGGEWERENLDTRIAILKDWMKEFQVGSNQTGISENIKNLFFKHVNVVGATCAHSGTSAFFKNFEAAGLDCEFDVVIVDEVSKATPNELLIPCLLGKKIVLVGDHKQLPPVVGEKSKKHMLQVAQEYTTDPERQQHIANEVERHLFSAVFEERFDFLAQHQQEYCRTMMLTTQYRMHEDIMAVINQFYEEQLIAGCRNEERQHNLIIDPWLLHSDKHVIWIDIPSDKKWEHEQMNGGPGRKNPREAQLVLRLLEDIVKASTKESGVSRKTEIGIISVYRDQADHLKVLIAQKRKRDKNFAKFAEQSVSIATGSVDEFQGMEKDIIILSMVLNQPDVPPSPFLRKPQRINVAMSRAKKLLVIVGSVNNYVRLSSEASSLYDNVHKVAIDRGITIQAEDTWIEESNHVDPKRDSNYTPSVYRRKRGSKKDNRRS